MSWCKSLQLSCRALWQERSGLNASDLSICYFFSAMHISEVMAQIKWKVVVWWWDFVESHSPVLCVDTYLLMYIQIIIYYIIRKQLLLYISGGKVIRFFLLLLHGSKIWKVFKNDVLYFIIFIIFLFHLN